VAQHRRQQGARRHRPGGDLIDTDRIGDADQIGVVGAILARAAAGEILPRFRALSPDQVRQKTSAFDIVTEADEAAEAVIAAGLEQAFPGALIVGEEASERDLSLLRALGSAELAFVVDPIDGTRNFASGLPLFGVMAAMIRRGEIVAGVIHDPICRDFAYAVRDGGAWLEREDGARTPLRVAPPTPVDRMEGVVGTTFLPQPLRDTVNGNLSKLATSTWLRCAAHEYRLAAAGHCHLLFYNKLMPWDHAAGWLLHREAGGYSAHFDGTPYPPTDLAGGLICAPDEGSWHAARKALLDIVD
jgi:fructose-1,6-bisphosphatase/inositol monophosphatase family enzyme